MADFRPKYLGGIQKKISSIDEIPAGYRKVQSSQTEIVLQWGEGREGIKEYLFLTDLATFDDTRKSAEELRRVLSENIQKKYSLSKDEASRIANRFVVLREATPTLMTTLHQDSDNNIVDDETKKNSRIIRDVYGHIANAVKMNASDVHFEARDPNISGEKSRIRFRVGGSMIVVHKDIPFHVMKTTLRVIMNTISNSPNFVETEPFSTSFQVTKEQYSDIPEDVRCRVEWTPVFDGADITIRILKKQLKTLKFHEMGYHPIQIRLLNRAIRMPQRMVILAGETGSGKSTTINTMLRNQISMDSTIKVRSVENPVEYPIPGASQSEVYDKATGQEDLSESFQKFLRSAMRGDPDVINVGEIRDVATAKLAVDATLTGHKVYSTIHAVSAIAVFDRLVEMGVPRNTLVSSDFIGMVIHQKLLPVVCPRCSINLFTDSALTPNKAAAPALMKIFNEDKLEIKEFIYRWQNIAQEILDGEVLNFRAKGINIANIGSKLRIHNPAGCKDCRGGFLTKRTAIAEVLYPTPTILTYIRMEQPMLAWLEWVKGEGITKLMHATIKAFEGILCPANVEKYIELVDHDIKMISAIENSVSTGNSDES